MLPEDAFLVNVARGSIVDEAAVIAALRSGHLGGAGLNVFVAEPRPASSPLWDLPGVIVTPHHSGNAVGWDRRAVDLFPDGCSLHNVVRTRRGY